MRSLNGAYRFLRKQALAQDFGIFLSNSVQVKSPLITFEDNTAGDAKLDDNLLFS